MRNFTYILAAFMLIGCTASGKIRWGKNRLKPPENDGVSVFYDWHEDPDSGLDCKSLKKRYYPSESGSLFRAIIRSLQFQGFNVGTMTEFVSDHDGIGIDDEEHEEYIHLYYSCTYLHHGIITFTHKKGDKKPRRIRLQNEPHLGEIMDPEDFYTTSFECLLDETCEEPKIKELPKPEKEEEKEKEPAPATKVTKTKDCTESGRVCIPGTKIEYHPSEPGAELDRNKFLELLNAYRAEQKVPRSALSIDDRLNKAAEGWAEYHKKKQLPKLKHEHGKSNPGKRVKKQKYNYFAVAENLGRVESIDPLYLLVSWKDSPEHNENMLRLDIQHIGLSCVHAPLKKKPDLAPWVCVLKLASEK